MISEKKGILIWIIKENGEQRRKGLNLLKKENKMKQDDNEQW